MITKIASQAPANVQDAKLASSIKQGASGTKAVDPKIAHVAAQFEEVFVRQLLTAAKMGGDNKEGGGYGAMTVDALATGVSQGGGMGIAKQIEMALSHASSPANYATLPSLDAKVEIAETPKK
jgi:Rod binding domain-containing protein